MEWLKPTLKHVLAVACALFVAVILIRLLNVSNDIAAAVIGLVMVALEKLVRAHPAIPVGDFVNEE